jgi:membrane associated rhomboid family serine protease
MANQWAPSQTPLAVRYLIVITCVISLLSALTNNAIVQLLKIQGPQDLLALSWQGIQHGYLWQPLSYMFIGGIGAYGIDFSYLISLFFSMYILWTIGVMVYERIGSTRFFSLYLGGGIVAGLLALWMMGLTSHYTWLAGQAAPLLALFTVWTMFYPDSIVMLFFIIPTQPKWILAGIIGALCIISLSQGDMVTFTLYLGSVLFGYLYGLLVLKLFSPFEFTHSFDRKVVYWISSFGKSEKKSSKTVDISTAQKQSSDEEFVDAMLSKISKYGEQSLTARERSRMEQISKRKTRQRPDDDN